MQVDYNIPVELQERLKTLEQNLALFALIESRYLTRDKLWPTK